MKIKNLLILGCLILGINSLSFAQTNLMANWAGPAGMGAGAPNEYGWDALTATGEPGTLVAFNTANASSGVRYRDVNESTSPQSMLDGAVWSGRLLYMRWDASGGASLTYVFSYPVTLEAGKQYNYSMLYQWWDNASAPTYTVAISRDKIGTDNIASADFVTETRREMRRGEMTFTAPTSGQYYVTYKSNTAALAGLSALRLVATSTTSSAKDLLASNYTIYPNPSNRADGLFIAANSTANEAGQLYIYNVTGQLQKQVDLKAAQDSKVDISDLAAGMYVAKVVTSKGSFNKTLVVK